MTYGFMIFEESIHQTERRIYSWDKKCVECLQREVYKAVLALNYISYYGDTASYIKSKVCCLRRVPISPLETCQGCVRLRSHNAHKMKLASRITGLLSRQSGFEESFQLWDNSITFSAIQVSYSALQSHWIWKRFGYTSMHATFVKSNINSRISSLKSVA